MHDLVFDGEVLQNREVDVVFSDGWLLSVRHSNGAEMAPAGKEALARFERQRGEHGSNDEGFLLWAILDVIVDRYFDVTTRSTNASTTSRMSCSIATAAA